MYILFLILIIPLLYLFLYYTSESYEPTAWFRQYKDYYSGSDDGCDNGCCDPVICSLKGKCQWRYNQNTYGGYPAMCLDFRKCLETESEIDCVKKIFNIN